MKTLLALASAAMLATLIAPAASQAIPKGLSINVLLRPQHARVSRSLFLFSAYCGDTPSFADFRNVDGVSVSVDGLSAR